MENFIEEILSQLVEEALEIKANASDEFQNGKLFGYYESISKIYNQADAFGVFDKLSKSLQEFKPESLLSELR
ncbi:MAG: hypothetical protein IPG18_17510 [Saprospiraceae bacterium]|nr:hypothetical protein [Saprospiraceae bacterium]MBK6566942.1 hypothetical protein [Saprospiraceae bacterium]MBK6783829.1 hypothetical protein [Saprospiraceae bacterium]MBK7525038.1 hypothetical protein [Saprospiraceae bacterium]MBK8372394.1 hypothetical protein [Saprospiraceae bacterium]